MTVDGHDDDQQRDTKPGNVRLCLLRPTPACFAWFRYVGGAFSSNWCARSGGFGRRRVRIGVGVNTATKILKQSQRLIAGDLAITKGHNNFRIAFSGSNEPFGQIDIRLQQIACH